MAGHIPRKEQALVESSFPQPLGMKGHLQHHETVQSIQLFSNKSRKKGPEWLKTDLILSFFSGVGARQAYRVEVQRYAEETKSVWEDFRHGFIVGTQQFVDKIKAQYVLQMPHREITHQKGLVGRINTKMFLEQVSRLFHGDLHRFRRAGRLYGEDKELRDLIVFLLWEKGSYTNREIGEVFSVSYTAVIPIVKKVKNHLKANPEYMKMYESINSQIKM